MFYIYLDDLRNPTTKKNWKIARTFEDFERYIKKDWQEFMDETDDWELYISFDHDIHDFDENGEELTGLTCMKFLVDYLIDNGYTKNFINSIQINVHSANPIGKANIEGYWKSYLRSL